MDNASNGGHQLATSSTVKYIGAERLRRVTGLRLGNGDGGRGREQRRTSKNHERVAVGGVGGGGLWGGCGGGGGENDRIVLKLLQRQE